MSSETMIVVFDGVCNLCATSVRFIYAHDRAGKFRFVAAQSAAGEAIQRRVGIHAIEEGTVILVKGNRAYVKSRAALEIARHLDGAWKLFYVLRFLPLPVRDALYGYVARNRYKWFGEKETCMLPSASLRSRFIE
ncbi:MAG: thiol-disulfide oxidoreductase DCC family protein [Moraxellaceae bacterium]|nr:thiol-disulfide oxidoreductase DCC family protein [Moraxellaceae bacterium]